MSRLVSFTSCLRFIFRFRYLKYDRLFSYFLIYWPLEVSKSFTTITKKNSKPVPTMNFVIFFTNSTQKTNIFLKKLENVVLCGKTTKTQFLQKKFSVYSIRILKKSVIKIISTGDCVSRQVVLSIYATDPTLMASYIQNVRFLPYSCFVSSPNQ